MLVKFAIEPDAIDDTTTQACANRLMTVWEHFGILAYPNFDVISIQIKRLPPGRSRRLWEVAWRRVRRNRHHYRHSYAVDDDFIFSGISEPHQLAQIGKFEVAVLEETRAAVLDIPEGEGKLFGEVEGVRLCEIDQSQKFQRSDKLSQEDVRINKSVEVLWQERFQRFAEHSQNVVIFDRFAVRDDNNQNIQGLFKLLDFLDRDANGCNIVIYSSPDPDKVESTEVDSIKGKLESKAAELNGSGIKSLEVRLFRNYRFRLLGHDRHIRFNDNKFKIGIGVELFHHPSVKQAMDCDQSVLELGKPEYRTRQLDNSKDGKIANFTIPVGTSAT